MDEKQKKCKQHAFDYYCKRVLRNEARDIYDEFRRRRKKETLFSELSVADQAKLFTLDTYFSDMWNFEVLDRSIPVNDESLGSALACLSEYRRNIILLAYFMDLPDRMIADLYNTKRANIRYHRIVALSQLRNILAEQERGDYRE